jgi:hypothetical protein
LAANTSSVAYYGCNVLTHRGGLAEPKTISSAAILPESYLPPGSTIYMYDEWAAFGQRNAGHPERNPHENGSAWVEAGRRSHAKSPSRLAIDTIRWLSHCGARRKARLHDPNRHHPLKPTQLIVRITKTSITTILSFIHRRLTLCRDTIDRDSSVLRRRHMLRRILHQAFRQALRT